MTDSSVHQPSIANIIAGEISKAVVGREELIEQALITILSDSHSQLEGVAGMGRWLVIQCLARCLGLQATKIRCSGDMIAEDLVLRPDGSTKPRNPTVGGRGPLFGNIVLVENMSRLPGKLQSLIHQAMQEHAVDAHGRRWQLPRPSVFFATRYPEDASAGEDSLRDDRFLLRVMLRYPSYHDEFNVSQTLGNPNLCEQVVTAEELIALQQSVPHVQIPPSVVHYVVRLVRSTRVHEGENPDFVYEWVQQGAGPRAVSSLLLAGKSRAVLQGRTTATHEDLRAVAPSVLRHRIVTNQNAQSNGITADRVIQRLLEDIPPRVVGDESPPQRGESLTYHDWIPIAESP